MFRTGLAALVSIWASISVAATEAEKLLLARGAEFAQGVIEVAEGVYTAVGFGVSHVVHDRGGRRRDSHRHAG